VCEGEFILVPRGTALLLLRLVSEFVPGGHDCCIICSMHG
jgi:hypothetical protein